MTDMAQPSPLSSPSPLGDADIEALRAARLRARKVRRAALIARLNGWTLLVFAVLSLVGLFFSWSAAPIALALGVIAWAELRGAKMFKRLEARACSWLKWNQIALALLILVYAGWMLLGAMGESEPSEIGAALAGADPQIAQMVEDLTRVVTITVYASLGMVGPIVPGFTAWYYASRRKHIDALLRDSPESTLDVFRQAA